MVQGVKSPLVTPPSIPIRDPVQIPSALLLIELRANVPGKAAEYGASIHVPVSQDGVSDYWVSPTPVNPSSHLVTEAADRILSPCLSAAPSLSVYLINNQQISKSKIFSLNPMYICLAEEGQDSMRW